MAGDSGVEAGDSVASGPRRPWFGRLDVFSLVVVLLGVVYVGLAWTPSSYGLVLSKIGLKGEGLVAGKPKGIRSDEWAVWTPYTQAAVNNGFERFNQTSPYAEDLRNFNSLPLKDWALPFKPQFWLFFVADPATAFSFSHALYLVLFLVGYHRLLRAFGFSPGWSAAASVLLFTTSFVQMWWTTVGPVMAVFPWLLLLVLTPWGPLARGLAAFWLTAFWLLAHLYPPMIISLAFAGLALLAAFRPEALHPRRLAAPLVGAALAGGLAWLYLSDMIPVMAATVYPGARVSAGGALPVWHVVSQALPTLMVTTAYQPVLAANVCEAAAVGTWMLPLLLVFADHRAWAARLVAATPEDRRRLWQLAVLLAMLAAMTAWEVAPIPAWAGKVLLWHMVPGARMLFASGLLALVIVLLLAQPAGLRLTPRRFAIFAGLTLSLLMVKLWLGGPAPWKEWKDLLPLAGLGVVALAAHRRPRLAGEEGAGGAGIGGAGVGGGAVLAAALLANVVAFGGFNPIQSAKPIFARHDTPMLRDLAERQAAHPSGWLVVDGHAGATLNGLGFRSISHVLAAPKLAFFREIFPDMPDDAFNTAFNRYAHVQPTSEVGVPVSPQLDVVQVPLAAFAGAAP